MAATPPTVTPTTTGRERQRTGPASSPTGWQTTTLIMAAVTVVSVALWIFAQLDSRHDETDSITWLLMCALMIAWPCNFGARAVMRMRAEIRELQQLVQTGSYRDGFADGYLSCAAVFHEASGAPGAGSSN